MKVWKKENVFGELSKDAEEGLRQVKKLFWQKGISDMYITAIRNGDHRPDSFHIGGNAFDMYYAKGITKEDMKEALGKDFDVVFHETHIHVEYDPKK